MRIIKGSGLVFIWLLLLLDQNDMSSYSYKHCPIYFYATCLWYALLLLWFNEEISTFVVGHQRRTVNGFGGITKIYLNIRYYINWTDNQNFRLWDGQAKSCLLWAGIILCMRPTNERQCYNVVLSLIGRAHSQNNPWWVFRRKVTVQWGGCLQIQSLC